MKKVLFVLFIGLIIVGITAGVKKRDVYDVAQDINAVIEEAMEENPEITHIPTIKVEELFVELQTLIEQESGPISYDDLGWCWATDCATCGSREWLGVHIFPPATCGTPCGGCGSFETTCMVGNQAFCPE